MNKKIGYFGKDVYLDLSTTVECDDESITVEIKGLTERDIARIHELGYSTTFKSSIGNDLPKFDGRVWMFIQYSDKNDKYNPNTTYFDLDIGKEFDLIFIGKKQGNFLNDPIECLATFKDWLNRGDNI